MLHLVGEPISAEYPYSCQCLVSTIVIYVPCVTHIETSDRRIAGIFSTYASLQALGASWTFPVKDIESAVMAVNTY